MESLYRYLKSLRIKIGVVLGDGGTEPGAKILEGGKSRC